MDASGFIPIFMVFSPQYPSSPPNLILVVLYKNCSGLLTQPCPLLFLLRNSMWFTFVFFLIVILESI